MREDTLHLHLFLIRLAKGMLRRWEYWVRGRLREVAVPINHHTTETPDTGRIDQDA